jgi:branched-subunit amino acid ABC-type transport system permease component
LVSDTVLSILVQICIVVLLCIGFTFTYMIERFPNFAHIDLTLIGTIVTFSMVKLLGINPYY